MPRHVPSPQDLNAAPSSRLRNYREFSGSRLTPEEVSSLFCGNPLFLRRIAEIAMQPYLIDHSSTLSALELKGA